MNELFKKAIADGASDIHIKAGDFVRARVDGDLVPLTDQKISHAQVRELALTEYPWLPDLANQFRGRPFPVDPESAWRTLRNSRRLGL